MLGVSAWAAVHATAPSAEAEALGRQVAEHGPLAAIFPLVTAKETKELVAEHPDWSDADKAALREATKAVQSETLAKLTTTLGHSYATHLSIEDLRGWRHSMRARRRSTGARRSQRRSGTWRGCCAGSTIRPACGRHIAGDREVVR